MSVNVGREVAELRRMTAKQLRQKYAEAFGEETISHNKVWMIKRIVWRLQARAEGGLSDRARQRAAELADDADLRFRPPPMKPAGDGPVLEVPFRADHRLPPPGTVLLRKYKGGVLQVRVRPDGFEYDGKVFASLSAVAKSITGSHCNGFAFFRIHNKGGDA